MVGRVLADMRHWSTVARRARRRSVQSSFWRASSVRVWFRTRIAKAMCCLAGVRVRPQHPSAHNVYVSDAVEDCAMLVLKTSQA